MPTSTRLPAALARRLPFFYGWIILACVSCVGFARQGPAVATLSIFISPMTEELGWSRTAISGAVSLGGILAAIVSPFLGPLLDRHGSRAMLCLAVLATGISVMLLSLVETLVVFYLLFCIGRMNFAGPFDLGIYGALNNWFVQRRPMATSIATLMQMLGLTAMPLIASAAIVAYGDWRSGWIAVGLTVLVVGFIPNWLFMVRRPEDIGLVPDRNAPVQRAGDPAAKPVPPPLPEPAFTRAEAVRTPAFWLLSLFTLLVYPVQAGISLHQAPHLIEIGISPTVAATVVSTFSIMSAVSGLLYGSIARRLSIRVTLASVGVFLGISAWLMSQVTAAPLAYGAAALFGLGIGGLLTMLPIAWADYFGRRSYGAIRGIALSVQVVSQAAGPLISGVLHDLNGDYTIALWVLSGCALSGAVVALFTTPPKHPAKTAAARA